MACGPEIISPAAQFPPCNTEMLKIAQCPSIRPPVMRQKVKRGESLFVQLSEELQTVIACGNKELEHAAEWTCLLNGGK